eukprot:Gb_32959 [translate_table: standard]
MFFLFGIHFIPHSFTWSLCSPSSSSPAMFGSASTPSFGTPSSTPFGTPASTPSMFGSTAPLFGSSAPSMFSSASPFGASSTPSLFGSSTPQSGAAMFGATQTPFGQPASSPAFGQTQPSLFGQPTQQQQQQQQQPSPFGQPLTFGQATSAFGQTQTPMFSQPSPFGQQQSSPGFGQQTQPSMFGTPNQQPLSNSSQLTTQMAPVAPLGFSLPDRDIQAIMEAYKDDPGNPKYGFKHLLFSVTDPSMRIKPVGVSDIMWAEAMNKLEGMDSADRERLWPELVQGFKDLSQRLKLQDEAVAADAHRLQATQTNVKLLQRHFQVDTVPGIQRMRQKEQELQRRLLRAMRIVEALEGKGFRMPPTKGEAHLGEKLAALARQLQGPSAELPRRVHTLLSISRMRANIGGAPTLLPGLPKIDDQSLGEMHEVLHQQTEAISRLSSVLKRDIRNMEIIMSEDTEMSDVSLESDVRKSSLHRILPSHNGNGMNGSNRRFLQ